MPKPAKAAPVCRRSGSRVDPSRRIVIGERSLVVLSDQRPKPASQDRAAFQDSGWRCFWLPDRHLRVSWNQRFTARCRWLQAGVPHSNPGSPTKFLTDIQPENLQTSNSGISPQTRRSCKRLSKGRFSEVYVADSHNNRIRLLTPRAVPTITRGGIVRVHSSVSVIQQGSWVSLYRANLAGATYQKKCHKDHGHQERDFEHVLHCHLFCFFVAAAWLKFSLEVAHAVAALDSAYDGRWPNISAKNRGYIYGDRALAALHEHRHEDADDICRNMRKNANLFDLDLATLATVDFIQARIAKRQGKYIESQQHGRAACHGYAQAKLPQMVAVAEITLSWVLGQLGEREEACALRDRFAARLG
jgi:hypothetical protein